MELWLIFAAGGVFLGGVFVYVLFMVFLPEWVGITGKTAIEAEKSHEGGAPAGPEILSRLQREHRRPIDELNSQPAPEPDPSKPQT